MIRMRGETFNLQKEGGREYQITNFFFASARDNVTVGISISDPRSSTTRVAS
jgi:hypothetical protein